MRLALRSAVTGIRTQSCLKTLIPCAETTLESKMVGPFHYININQILSAKRQYIANINHLEIYKVVQFYIHTNVHMTEDKNHCCSPALYVECSLQCSGGFWKELNTQIAAN